MNPARRLFAAACLALAATAALAQPYPARPIRFIVPNPPGGGTDLLSRLVASRLGEANRWQIVVDNRPGAGGNIGLEQAAKSPADGYTIAMGETSNLAINPTLYARLPYDPARDLAPVMLVGSVPLVLVVAPARPFVSLPALTGAAKSGSLSFASAGNGTVGHLVGEIFKRVAGVSLLHVPYKGAAPAMTDLMGGQVDLFFASLPAAVAHIKSGKLRALAVTSARRAQALPELPTLAESGFGELVASPWYGIVAPAGIPADIVLLLNAELNRLLQQPDLQARLASDGVEAVGGTPAAFAAFMAAERERWSRAVRDSGARID